MTGLAVTDIEIFKGTSMTQRSSDAGVVLLDTDGIDVDGVTGIHGFSIDTSDNTDAGFYAVGGFFTVVVASITVDSQTVNFVAGTFRLSAAEAIAGKPKVDVDAWLGTAAATPTVNGVPEVDVTHWLGTAAATPTVAGVPEVDVTHLLGTAWLAPGTAGTPDVNVKLWNALTTVALPLIPTVVGRTLDVSAGGEAGIDWANIGTPTSVVNLSATNIDVDQIVASVSGAAGSVTGAVGSIAAGGIAAASFAAGAIDAAAIAANAIGASELATDAVNEIADAVWEELASDHVAVGSLGQRLAIIRANTAQAGAGSTITLDAAASAVDNFYNNNLLFITGGLGAGQGRFITDYTGATKVADVSAWVTNPDATSVFVIVPFGSIPGATAPTAAEVATAVVEKTLTEGYAADGAAPTLQQALIMNQQMLMEMSISGTTLTIKKLDGSTTAMTFTLTLGSDNLPTAITRAS
jgi:hypothetical protein